MLGNAGRKPAARSEQFSEEWAAVARAADEMLSRRAAAAAPAAPAPLEQKVAALEEGVNAMRGQLVCRSAVAVMSQCCR